MVAPHPGADQVELLSALLEAGDALVRSGLRGAGTQRMDWLLAGGLVPFPLRMRREHASLGFRLAAGNLCGVLPGGAGHQLDRLPPEARSWRVGRRSAAGAQRNCALGLAAINSRC